MNLLRLATRELRGNPVGSALAVLLMAFGIATLVLLNLLLGQMQDRFERDARGVDLVVGAKGSPMQLILSGVYHLDAPTGNVRLRDVEQLRALPQVRQVIPLALGDSFRGARIVGAPAEYLELYQAQVATGRGFRAPMEVVLGAAVARRLELAPGSRFNGAHGLGEGGPEHEDAAYTVVGVLAPSGSPLDQLILTPIDSVWQVHASHGPAMDEPGKANDRRAAGAEHDDHAEHGADDDHDAHETHEGHPSAPEREVTVALVQYASPLAAATLPRLINRSGALQAASPAFESARLMRLVGVGAEVLQAFAGVLVLASAAALLAALLATLRQRRYDIAVMRMLGASRARVFATIVLEALLLTTLGAVAGLALGHALAAGLGTWLASQGPSGMEAALGGVGWRAEALYLLPLAWVIGLAAAVLPAWQAARTDVAALLARG